MNKEKQDALLDVIRSGKYYADEHGFIYSLAVGNVPRKLGSRKSRCGYCRVLINGRDYQAHHFVWLSFRGEIQDGMVINHKNGKKDDNAIANLELVTQLENVRHSMQIGTNGHYNKTWVSRANRIKELIIEGKNNTQIANIMGCSRKVSSRIRNGSRYAWLFSV